MPNANSTMGRRLFMSMGAFLVVSTVGFATPMWLITIAIDRGSDGIAFILFTGVVWLLCGLGWALLMWRYFKPQRERIRAAEKTALTTVHDA